MSDIFVVTDPTTGLKVKLTGDSPPTEQELNDIFSKLKPPQSATEDPLAGLAERKSFADATRELEAARSGVRGAGSRPPMEIQQRLTSAISEFNKFEGKDPLTPEEIERFTPAAERLTELSDPFGPELLSESDLEDQLKTAKISAALLFTPNPEEQAKILSSNYPHIGITYDPEGNVYATNNETGVAVILNKPGASYTDILQTVGIGASFTPAGRVATLPKLAGAGLGKASTRAAAVGGASALTEAAIQKGQEVAGGDFDSLDVVLSGITGAGGQLAGEAGSAALRGKTGAIPQAEKEIIEAGEKLDVPVKTTDVIEPQVAGKMLEFIGERTPIVGTGGDLAAQQEARKRIVEELGESFAPVSPDAIFKSLTSKAGVIKAKAGERISSIINTLKVNREIPLDDTIKAIDDGIAALSAKGKVKDTSAISALERIRLDMVGPKTRTIGAAGGSVEQRLKPDFEVIRNNRTSVREMKESFDPNTKSQMGSFGKGILTRVEKAMTRDLDEAVKAAEAAKVLNADGVPISFRKYKQADTIYGREANMLIKSKLKVALDKGDITPEVAEKLIFAGDDSQTKLLFKNLTPEGRNNARALLVKRAFDKFELAESNPDVFVKELAKLKNKTNIFFKGEERAKLEGLKNLLIATKGAGKKITPFQASVGLGGGLVAGGLLGLKAIPPIIAGGLSAKTYQSPVMRDFLLKLSNTPPNSVKFDRILRESLPALNTLLQVDRSLPDEESTP